MTGSKHLADLDDEIRDHLEQVAAELVDGGMTPAAARAEARRRFGSISLTKENTRAVWYPVWLEQLVQDLRGVLRMLRRSPGFSAVVVLTLMIGIGLNTAIFSVVNAVLLQPLSYPHPERMLWLGTLDPRDSEEFATSVDVLAWREATSLVHILAYDEYEGRVIDGATRGSARIATVSDDFWAMSGARAELGGIPSSPEPAYVLSRSYFERRFGGNPDVIGRTITAGGRRAPIVAVLAPGFRADLVPPRASAWLTPADVDIYEVRPVRALPSGMIQIFHVVAEMKPGVVINAARAELESIHERVSRERAGPLYRPTLRVMTLKDRLVAEARRPLLVLLVAVGAVLLVVCANVASLFLARASAHHRELAIRAAIGAGRGRLLRQLLAETLVLALSGGALGVLLSRALVGVATRLIPGAVPRLMDARVDTRVLLFAAGLSVLTALIFGLAPMLSMRQVGTYEDLKEGTRTVSTTERRVRFRSWLVAGELAITLMLLCGAGLLVKSLWRLTTYPPGFAPERVLTVSVSYERSAGNRDREQDEVHRKQYIRDVLERLSAAPGVEAAGLTTDRSGRLRLIVEHAAMPENERPAAFLSAVSSGYASAIGLRLTKGRWVTDAEPVTTYVVNETLVRRLFGNDDPTGRRLQIDGPIGATEAQGGRYATIVGVVADLKNNNLNAATQPDVFVDYAHAFPSVMIFAVRVSGDPSALAPTLRTLVAGVDPAQSIRRIRTVESALDDSVAPQRFTMLLLSTFASFALLLALIGIYGVIAYSVSLRTGEIGVRMALGARRRSIVWLVVRQGLTIAVPGLVLGLAGAFAATRAMTSLLYDVAPTDPATFIIVSVVLLGTAAAACCGPAIKAARMDPVVALRCE